MTLKESEPVPSGLPPAEWLKALTEVQQDVLRNARRLGQLIASAPSTPPKQPEHPVSVTVNGKQEWKTKEEVEQIDPAAYEVFLSNEVCQIRSRDVKLTGEETETLKAIACQCRGWVTYEQFFSAIWPRQHHLSATNKPHRNRVQNLVSRVNKIAEANGIARPFPKRAKRLYGYRLRPDLTACVVE